jgi:hypothetical protein
MARDPDDIAGMVADLKQARANYVQQLLNLSTASVLSYTTPGGTSVSRQQGMAWLRAEIEGINAAIAALDPSSGSAPGELITAVR